MFNKNKKENSINKIEKIQNYYRKMNENPEKVLKYVNKKVIEILSLSDKSRYEIEEKIFKNIDREQHYNIVFDRLNHFENLNYINDERYSSNYIRLKYNSGYGKEKIIRDLQDKKIENELIEKNIEKYDFKESLIDYKNRSYKNLKEATSKEMNKVFQRLIKRGFKYSDVKEVFSDISIIKEEKENKYKETDLNKFIDKMTKKGYGINKIKQEANNKNLDLKDFDFNNIDFSELAKIYKLKKFGKEKEIDNNKKRKQINHLLSRGFVFDDFKNII